MAHLFDVLICTLIGLFIDLCQLIYARMNQLAGDDALVDEEFWKMDLFKEDEEDEEYKSEAGMTPLYDLYCDFIICIAWFYDMN
jgi:hypothetical protein